MSTGFTLTENPQGLARAEAEMDAFMRAFNEECGLQLYENLDASTSTRTGEHYAGQPRVSSRPTEMPQEQSGGLQRMVGTGKLAPCRYWWGLAPKTKEELEQARTQELGFPRGNVIARAPTLRTGFDTRTHRRATEAGKRAV